MNKSRKPPGRWVQFNVMCDHTARTLSPTEFAVWVQLFRHADTIGKVTVSQTRLADLVGFSNGLSGGGRSAKRKGSRSTGKAGRVRRSRQRAFVRPGSVQAAGFRSVETEQKER